MSESLWPDELYKTYSENLEKDIYELKKEIRSLERKVKRRDNKIIDLEKKVKHYEKLLYKLGLRPLQIKFVPKGYLQEDSNE
ncbi:MAG: hypothetical protein J5617_03765 [Bacilli bacterium]|nr:hypothetical protein [Bacilli bacterium]